MGPRSLALCPDHAPARANVGLALLLNGDFENGWQEHEWRRKLPNPLFQRAGRSWDGSDPFGQTLLLYGEGGLGNVIQFARYATVLAELGAIVIVECRPELVSLMRSVKGVRKVIATGEHVPHYDLHCPLMSVPAILNTTSATIPVTVPYLHPPGDVAERWCQVLHTVTGYRVGICWQGNQRVKHLRDRSFPPAQLLPLAQMPSVSLINLQQGEDPPAELPILTLPGLGPGEMKLEDVAAVIQHLDLVITCDTSIAHLAGGLGVPVWVALKHAACWRWMLDCEDSPWYPTMRLFRQQAPMDWNSVSDRMAECLKIRLSSPAAAASAARAAVSHARIR